MFQPALPVLISLSQAPLSPMHPLAFQPASSLSWYLSGCIPCLVGVLSDILAYVAFLQRPLLFAIM